MLSRSNFSRWNLSLAAAVAALAAMASGAAAAPFSTLTKPYTNAAELQLTGSNKTPGAKVKGYSQRRGGYSYYAEDSINTYGDARTKYGSASTYRDPSLDHQTNSGPFDHGFFFDSAVGPRGGDSPYMN